MTTFTLSVLAILASIVIALLTFWLAKGDPVEFLREKDEE